MPNIFKMYGYCIYFWSNEAGEPVHVHISEGTPTPNATKIWLTSSGGCMVANNNSRIPKKDLGKIMDAIIAHFFIICRKWKEYFFVNDLAFYC
jgi:hypothetical protein